MHNQALNNTLTKNYNSNSTGSNSQPENKYTTKWSWLCSFTLWENFALKQRTYHYETRKYCNKMHWLKLVNWQVIGLGSNCKANQKQLFLIVCTFVDKIVAYVFLTASPFNASLNSLIQRSQNVKENYTFFIW